jgi:GNAT superfamily N-acetyltransferase
LSENPISRRKWQVEPCRFDEVKRYRSPAAREQVKVDNPDGTVFLCVRNLQPERFGPNGKPTFTTRIDNRLAPDAILGFAGMFIRNGSARLKADYVLPNYRCRGIGRALIAERLQMAADQGATVQTAFCTKMSLPLYLAAGFQEIRRNAHDIAFCRRESK